MLYGHGGDVYTIAKELGIKPQEVLDFSSNCSPLPYPEGFKEYICSNIDQMHLLPEVDCETIRGLLAKRYDLHQDHFLIGNGTTQWIFGLPRLLRPKRAFITLPTYADYEDACLTENITVYPLGSFPRGDRQEEEHLFEAISSQKKEAFEDSLVFICNPNNPTGLFLEPAKLLELIQQMPETTTWVIDESYAPFVGEDQHSSLLGLELPENVVLLRSFSKIYGIPGLRIGCMVNRGYIQKRLAKQMRPWAVNRMAQLALEFLLTNPGFEEEVRQTCQLEKRFLVERLSRLDKLQYVEGRCHYALFRLTGGLKAKDLTETLKKKGILIRNCNNFKGLTGEHIRISPRLRRDNERLLTHMETLCK